MIRASLDILSRSLTHDGDTIPLEEGGLSRLRELVAAGDPDTEIVVPMSVYQAGWNRNSWEIHPSSLDAYAASMENNPILHDHNSSRRVGRGGEGWIWTVGESTGLAQDVIVSTRLGLSMLAEGGSLRASISPAHSKSSQFLCSICKREWLSEGCDHYQGDVGEDGPWRLQITDMIHRETSLTHYPACDGTGTDAPTPETAESEPSEGESVATEAAAVPYILGVDGLQLGTAIAPHGLTSVLSDTMRARFMARMSGLKASVEEVRARLSKIQADNDRLSYESASRYVTDIRRKKALKGKHEDLVKLYLDSPETFQTMAAAMPDNRLHETVSKISPPPPAVVPTGDITTRAQALHAEVQRISAETGEDPRRIHARIRDHYLRS